MGSLLKQNFSPRWSHQEELLLQEELGNHHEHGRRQHNLAELQGESSGSASSLSAIADDLPTMIQAATLCGVGTPDWSCSAVPHRAAHTGSSIMQKERPMQAGVDKPPYGVFALLRQPEDRARFGARSESRTMWWTGFVG